MDVFHRNNIQVCGRGERTLVFGHGFGCDLHMWRMLAPAFEDRFKVVVFDLVGNGASDLSAYDPTKYASLQGYADDLLEIIAATSDAPVHFVGHSVTGMIGMLADLKSSALFASHIMVSPSPAYINEGDYVGGFSREDIEDMLLTLDSNNLAGPVRSRQRLWAHRIRLN